MAHTGVNLVEETTTRIEPFFYQIIARQLMKLHPEQHCNIDGFSINCHYLSHDMIPDTYQN